MSASISQCHEVLDFMPVGVMALDRDFKVRTWNKTLETWTGHTAGDMIGHDIRVFYPHLAKAMYTARIEPLFEGGPPAIFSAQLHGGLVRCELPGGGIRLMHTVAVANRLNGAGEYQALFTFQDVSEAQSRLNQYSAMRESALKELAQRKRTEQALRENEALLSGMVNSSFDAVVVSDAKGRVEFWSPAATRIFDYTEEQAPGLTMPWSLISGSDCAMFTSAVADCEKGERSGFLDKLHEVWATRSSGDSFPAEVVLAEVGTGSEPRFMWTVRDITEQKKARDRLREMATTDELTGVANRRHFLDTAAREYDRTMRYGGDLSLIMMDADHFKDINDRHGHETGDRILKALAANAEAMLRTSDLLGRMGGEEFAAILPHTDADQARKAAQRIRQAVENIRLMAPEGPVEVTVSIGVAQAEGSEVTLRELLRRADKALYAAKSGGRNRVVTWESMV